jgi:hypothetical protein
VKVSELVEVFAREPDDAKADYLARMARTAVERGYKPGWVGMKYQAKYGAWPAALNQAIREAARQESKGP